MQLRHDQVLVVARVAEVGGADAVAGQVEQFVVRVDQQVAGLGRVVELRAARRSLAVDAAEVELRRVVVGHRPRVLLLLGQRGLVEGHVVVDELAEVDVAGRHRLVVERDVAVLDVVQRRLAVVHLQGQRGEQGVRRVVGRQPLEHHPEAGLAVAAEPERDVGAARVAHTVRALERPALLELGQRRGRHRGGCGRRDGCRDHLGGGCGGADAGQHGHGGETGGPDQHPASRHRRLRQRLLGHRCRSPAERAPTHFVTPPAARAG